VLAFRVILYNILQHFVLKKYFIPVVNECGMCTARVKMEVL